VTELEILARGVVAAGFEGETPNPALPVFGAYVLFARNAVSLAQVRALTDALRERPHDDAPALIAVDQEGGRVARIRDGVEPMPSFMALGAAGDLELAGRAGEQIAFDLRRAGCTMDLAPVLDLALCPENTAIGTRSAGADPRAVADIAAAFGAGLERGGMLPCYKHFPGQGATPEDSHAMLPEIAVAETVLRVRELVPFAAVVRSAPAMMSAHVLVTAFDARRPATTSRAIASDLLRGELGFNGALLSDCLQMSAVADLGEVTSTAVDALAAGVDLLVVSHDVELAGAIVDAIARAVSQGALPQQRLAEAYARVKRLRVAPPPPLGLQEFAPHRGVGREIARRAITLVRGLAYADPLTTLAVSFEGETFEGINTTAVRGGSLRREAPALSQLELPIDPRDEHVGRALAAIAQSGRRPLMLARRAHLHAGQARAIDAIAAEYPDAIAVSMLEPFDVPLFSRAHHVLAAYGDDAAAIAGLADVLFGGSMPEGRLPVDVEASAFGA
jgi:beta-N-acetylhexosaminidase